MAVGLYRVDYRSLKFAPTEEELSFLERYFPVSVETGQFFQCYVDQDKIDEAINRAGEDGVVIPDGLIFFLEEQLKSGDFDLAIM